MLIQSDETGPRRWKASRKGKGLLCLGVVPDVGVAPRCRVEATGSMAGVNDGYDVQARGLLEARSGTEYAGGVCQDGMMSSASTELTLLINVLE